MPTSSVKRVLKVPSDAPDCFAKAAAAAGLNVINRTSNTADNASGAAKVAADLLSKYPDVDAFWDYNDASAEGVSAAVIAAGKKVLSGSTTTGVQVWGNSADGDGIKALKQGRITGTMDSNLVASGWAVVKVMKRPAQR
jgi:ribose transport system substrate-binding protein